MSLHGLWHNSLIFTISSLKSSLSSFCTQDKSNMPTFTTNMQHLWIITVLVGTTQGMLFPHLCNNDTFEYAENVHIFPCHHDSELQFTVTSPSSHFVIHFLERLDLRTMYIRCNTTDNKTLTLRYNDHIDEVVHLCPDQYPGYYYSQYFYTEQNDVQNISISIKFGDENMQSSNCIHDHNSRVDQTNARYSARFPNGGVYPITCSMRMWHEEKSQVNVTNIAAYDRGTRCNYWRPRWGLGQENYCKRLLDGYLDPWKGPFAFSEDTETDLEGSWVQFTFPQKYVIIMVAWIQHKSPLIRRFMVNDDNGGTEYINCELNMTSANSMQWERYSIGPYKTSQLTLTFVDVQFDDDQFSNSVGFYEVEIFGFTEDSYTTDVVQKTTVTDSTTSYKTDVLQKTTVAPKESPTRDNNDQGSNLTLPIIIPIVVLSFLLVVFTVVYMITKQCNKEKTKPMTKLNPINRFANHNYLSPQDVAFIQGAGGDYEGIPGAYPYHPSGISTISSEYPYSYVGTIIEKPYTSLKQSDTNVASAEDNATENTGYTALSVPTNNDYSTPYEDMNVA